MVKKLTFLDQAFGFTESDNSPKHVAGLQILELPEDASESFYADFIRKLKSFDKAVSPFNSVAVTFLKFPLRLKVVDKMDMDYHIKEHVLDDISDRETLHQYVARLHETRLDITKPLWQCHLLRSEQGREFAVYLKIHHMYGDGFTLVKWQQASLSKSMDTEDFKPYWVVKHRQKVKSEKLTFKSFMAGTWDFLVALKDFLWICFRVFLKLIRVNTAYMPIPFTGTKTVLTGQVKKGRVVTTTDISYDRIYKLSKRMRASINEVFLCCFDIATRRFLREYGQTFDKALFTNVPINLRKPGDHSMGNKLAILPVALAHKEKDPYLRLRQIIENHRVVIRSAKDSHPGAFSYYTVFIQFTALLYEIFHLSDFVHPIANILISNMPGPRNTMYFNGCKLKSIYPISTITPGGGINFTLMTYDDTANIGIVCCNKNIKTLEPLVQYFQEAFDMLEKSIENTDLNIDDIGQAVVNNKKAEADNHHKEPEQ